MGDYPQPWPCDGQGIGGLLKDFPNETGDDAMSINMKSDSNCTSSHHTNDNNITTTTKHNTNNNNNN